LQSSFRYDALPLLGRKLLPGRAQNGRHIRVKENCPGRLARLIPLDFPFFSWKPQRMIAFP
jgi:hypothetical protein